MKKLILIMLLVSSMFALDRVQFGKNTITMIDGDDHYTYSKYSVVTLHMDKDDRNYRVKFPGMSNENWIYSISKDDYEKIKRVMDGIE
jgi:hypothetical protein